MRAARQSQLFIPTLKEAPADAQVASHRLLVRAGFIRQLGAGIYEELLFRVLVTGGLAWVAFRSMRPIRNSMER